MCGRFLFPVALSVLPGTCLAVSLLEAWECVYPVWGTQPSLSKENTLQLKLVPSGAWLQVENMGGHHICMLQALDCVFSEGCESQGIKTGRAAA